MKIFAMGSCRVGYIMKQIRVLKLDQTNTYNTVFSTLSIGNIIQFMESILGVRDVPIKYLTSNFEFNQKRSEIDLALLKELVQEADIFVFEVSSLKEYEHDGFSLNSDAGLRHELKLSPRIIDREELHERMAYLQELLEVEKHCKQIVYVPHFNVLSPQTMQLIENRRLLVDYLLEGTRNLQNNCLFDPSKTLFDQDYRTIFLQKEDGSADLNHLSKWGASMLAEDFMRLLKYIVY